MFKVLRTYFLQGGIHIFPTRQKARCYELCLRQLHATMSSVDYEGGEKEQISNSAVEIYEKKCKAVEDGQNDEVRRMGGE